ncbi:MAG: adenosylcobinamide-GDP ribazoletransferase [Candidatus Binatia bacterium]
MIRNSEPHRGDESEGAEWPRWQDFLNAVALLTLAPLPRPDRRSEGFGRATLFFPLVGLLIGALLVGLNAVIAGRLPHWLAGIALVAAWEALGRAEVFRACLDEGRAGVPVTMASGALLLVKTVAVGATTAARPAALLFAPMLARWCMVVLAVGTRDAETAGRKFNSSITFREFALTSVFTFGVVFGMAQAFGLFVVLCAAGACLVLRLLSHQWANGVSWRFLLASAEGIEALVAAIVALA